MAKKQRDTTPDADAEQTQADPPRPGDLHPAGRRHDATDRQNDDPSLAPESGDRKATGPESES